MFQIKIVWKIKTHSLCSRTFSPKILPFMGSSRRELTVTVSIQGFFFYGEELLAPRPTPKLENHLLSSVRDCLFNILAATVHTGDRSSIRNLRTRHAVVTGTHLSWDNVKQSGTAKQATHDNKMRCRKDTLFVPDSCGKNRHTLDIQYLLLQN